MIKFSVVAGIILQDHKVLMCRSHGKELYYLPGGKIEANETESQAMIRECKEELNIEIIPETLEKFCRFEADAYGFPEPRIVIMNCYLFQYQGHICPSAEIDDVFWADAKDTSKLAPAAKVLLEILMDRGFVN